MASAIDSFLQKLDVATKPTLGTKRQFERVLFNLLSAFKDQLPDITDDYFHKAFRQCDVICVDGAGGHIDSAIWLLLDSAEIFWDVRQEFLEERKNN